MLDVNSFAFQSYANQPAGYYTPTPGGLNTFYHNQAGDLHTPGMGLNLGLGTPLSGPTSEAGLHMMDYTYGTSMIPQQYQDFHPYSQPPHPHQEQQPQQTFAPSSFVHQDTGYETMEHDGSPTDDDILRMDSVSMSLEHSPLMHFPQPTSYDATMLSGVSPFLEKFRFHVTLNAPTAMIKHADEIPVTYLNKGQAYTVSIVDTMPTMPLPIGTRYRSFIRVSFEDEQQRQKPGTCWQLWKEGRGINEAHQRGGKLQAVEFVEANQPADTDDKRTRISLDTASFDGFSVSWTPGSNGSADCNIAVRFNFLSTDFSHSKGVKGIPVRLCAKTEQYQPNSLSTLSETAEVAFCKVKLFRDHGAERKLSNDVAHVKKTIEKLKQQITQSETGLKDFSKRKRTGSVIAKPEPSQKPGKVHKHKRTWSMSTTSSSGGRPPLEEELHYKLQTMQDMFTSTRPVSILYLRGDHHDDPDAYPVTLAGEPVDLTKLGNRNDSALQEISGRDAGSGMSSLLSPSPNVALPKPFSTMTSGSSANNTESQNRLQPEDRAVEIYQLASPPDQITRVAKSSATGLNGWIEAVDVDPLYIAPVEATPKPVACFYVRCQKGASPGDDNKAYYKAIYMAERSLNCFKASVAAKWKIPYSSITDTIRMLSNGLEVEIDDDVVREMSEGQDMVVEFVPCTKSNNRDTSMAEGNSTVSRQSYVLVVMF